MSENEIFTAKLHKELTRMLMCDVNTAFNVLYEVLATWVYETNKDLDSSKRESLLDKIIQDTRLVIDQHRYARLPNETDWPINYTEAENVETNTPTSSDSKTQKFRKLVFKMFDLAITMIEGKDEISAWRKQQTHKAELLTVLNQMPADVAIRFLPELIGAWCLSYPREKARQYFFNPSEITSLSDTAFADRLFGWILQPFDYFK